MTRRTTRGAIPIMAAVKVALLCATCILSVSNCTRSTTTSSDKDVQFVDDYLKMWDRFTRGENGLVPFINQNREKFESKLAKLLNSKDKRAPARLVFYTVVQGGGGVPAESELGKACASFLGEGFHVSETDEGKEYFACHLYYWWLENKSKYDEFPLFVEWSKSKRAKEVVIPAYESACKRNK